MSFDIARARRETRGCDAAIHFNNAGAALMPAPVVDRVTAFLKQEELEGGYEIEARLSKELETFYTSAAQLINGRPQEIAFVDSATRAWMMAFYSFKFQPGDRILTGRAEYGSNLVGLWHLAQKTGVKIIVIPDDPHGQIDTEILEENINKCVKLICLTHIPSGNGLVNPAEAVGQIARSHNIPYLLDTCQTLGQRPVDVEKLGCDILCGTGRKFLRGPRGTGLLYVRQQLLDSLEPPMLNHHSADLHPGGFYHLRPDARRFECWERSLAGQLGLTAAIDYALAWGLDNINSRITGLADKLRDKLRSLDGVRVHDQGIDQCGIVTFTAEQTGAASIKQQLFESGIHTSLLRFSANPLLFDQGQPTERVRASLHYYNTEEELNRFIEVVSAQLK